MISQCQLDTKGIYRYNAIQLQTSYGSLSLLIFPLIHFPTYSDDYIISLSLDFKSPRGIPFPLWLASRSFRPQDHRLGGARLPKHKGRAFYQYESYQCQRPPMGKEAPSTQQPWRSYKIVLPKYYGDPQRCKCSGKKC